MKLDALKENVHHRERTMTSTSIHKPASMFDQRRRRIRRHRMELIWGMLCFILCSGSYQSAAFIGSGPIWNRPPKHLPMATTTSPASPAASDKLIIGAKEEPQSPSSSSRRTDGVSAPHFDWSQARIGLPSWPSIPSFPSIGGGQASKEAMIQASTPRPFSMSKAVLLAPFAFEVYNDPSRDQGWWQQGPDQTEVAILSERFLRQAYGGTLRVRILGLTESRPPGLDTNSQTKSKESSSSSSSSSWFPTRLQLPGRTAEGGLREVMEATISVEVGNDYVGTQRLQLNKTVAAGDVPGRIQYTPIKSGSGGDTGNFSSYISNRWERGDYILTLTLLGEDKTSLGTAELNLNEVMRKPRPKGNKLINGVWRKELILTTQPSSTAMASSFAAAEGKGKGGRTEGDVATEQLAEVALGLRVEVDLQFARFIPSSKPISHKKKLPGNALGGGSSSTSTSAAAAAAAAVKEQRSWKGATGCSCDWRELAESLGGDALEAADMELLAFIENKVTDAQLKLWRDESRKRLVVAFRGTEFWKVRDIITDLKLLQDPWDVHQLEEGLVAPSSFPPATLPALPAASVSSTAPSTPLQSSATSSSTSSSYIDVYSALATQANNTWLLYNDLDKAVKEIPGWVGSYMDQMWRSFGSTTISPKKPETSVEEEKKPTTSTTSVAPVRPPLPPSSSLAVGGRRINPLQSSSSLLSTNPALAPSVRSAEVDLKGKHCLVILNSTPSSSVAPQSQQGNAFRVGPSSALDPDQPPMALVAPGLDSSASFFLPRRLEPVWLSRICDATGINGKPPAPPQATTAADKAVADVFVSVLDKVIGAVPGFKFFIQPDSGQVRSMADFRTAFYEVATRTAGALGSQMLPTSSSFRSSRPSSQGMNKYVGVHDAEILMEIGENAPVQEEEGEAFFQQALLQQAESSSSLSSSSSSSASTTTPDIMALVGQGNRSPLLILPSRFRTVFESLVNETLRSMDSSALTKMQVSNPIMAAALLKQSNSMGEKRESSSSKSLPTLSSGKTTSSPAAQSDFTANIFTSLDQVLVGLQEKQLQLGAAAFNATSLVGSQIKLPPMDVESFGVTEKPRVHAGFRESYLSVRTRLLELIDSATGGRLKEEGWEILTTGHSMGGSLATLLTHDLSVKYPHNKISMYSYGQPRTGNTAFAQGYAKANGDSFRIVNEWDVIARFPRSLNASIFNYDHAGRTVLLNAPNASFWIEGVNSGPCPLRDLQPLRPSSSAVNKDNNKGSSSKSSSSIELEPLFLEAEWQLLNAFFTGAGFTSHLEYRYFESLLAAHRGKEEVPSTTALTATAVAFKAKARGKEEGPSTTTAATAVTAAVTTKAKAKAQQPASTTLASAVRGKAKEEETADAALMAVKEEEDRKRSSSSNSKGSIGGSLLMRMIGKKAFSAAAKEEESDAIIMAVKEAEVKRKSSSSTSRSSSKGSIGGSLLMNMIGKKASSAAVIATMGDKAIALQGAAAGGAAVKKASSSSAGGTVTSKQGSWFSGALGGSRNSKNRQQQHQQQQQQQPPAAAELATS